MSLLAQQSFPPEAVGYGQQGVDALMELDKGLRSRNVGEQCEAVALFPELFRKYPSPYLVNSAFHKLADVFAVPGNNFLRLCVLKVVQRSEKHLEKIHNADPLVSRVFSVMRSNDPVARAVTLRTLASLASIIPPERKNAVHHSVRQSLDSDDGVEVEAAVFAAAIFSARSKDFAAAVANRVGEMIRGPNTPVDLKLKLIPVMQHMHHDIGLASSSRGLLTQLVSSYPSSAMVIVTLHTLTRLAASSLVHVPEQLQILFRHLKDDPRRSVKRLAIQDLMLLAKKAPHLWSGESTRTLCECAQSSPYVHLKLGMLAVLSALSGTVAAKQRLLPPPLDELVKLARECCYHGNVAVATHGVVILTNVTASCPEEKDAAQLEQTSLLGVQSLLVLCSQDHGTRAHATLRVALTCLVRLSKGRPHLGPAAVDFLLCQLQSTCDSCRVFTCRALCAIATGLPALGGDGVLGDLAELCGGASGRSAADRCPSSLSAKAKSVAEQQLEKVADGWTAYRIARQASHLGFHALSAELYGSLRSHVASERFYFWLDGLKEFSRAESRLARMRDGDTVGALTEALCSYQKAVASLAAAGTPPSPLSFQRDFVRLRADTLRALLQLLCTCNSLKTSPPPAIAAAVLGSEPRRCGVGHVSAQMKGSAEEFRYLAARYADLHRSSFDADHATLRGVELQQQSCLLVSHMIEALMLDEPRSDGCQGFDGTLAGSARTESEHERRMTTVFDRVLEEVDGLSRRDPPASYYIHAACLCDAVVALLEVPLSFPRYFFQKLQATSVKFALSPSPRTPNEPIPTQSGQHLALKVEGAAVHHHKPTPRPRLFRKVCSVCLTATSVLQGRTTGPDEADRITPDNRIEQRVQPHGDYFSTQFLLGFSDPGTYVVTVEASVLDEGGVEWKTGPKVTVLVKSMELYSQQQQQQARAQPALQQNVYGRFLDS